MDIGPAALQALIAAAVMAGLYVAIVGAWSWRLFLALWLPLSILVFIIIHGPIQVG